MTKGGHMEKAGEKDSQGRKGPSRHKESAAHKDPTRHKEPSRRKDQGHRKSGGHSIGVWVDGAAGPRANFWPALIGPAHDIEVYPISDLMRDLESGFAIWEALQHREILIIN